MRNSIFKTQKLLSIFIVTFSIQFDIILSISYGLQPGLKLKGSEVNDTELLPNYLFELVALGL